MLSDEGEYDSDAEVEDKEFKPAFVIIAIDTHPVMFRKMENDSIPFKDCLEACLALSESLILTQSRSNWNQFAVVLAKENSLPLIKFHDNLVDSIKDLKEKARWSVKQLTEEYQRKGKFDLANFFLACKKTFQEIKMPFYKRTLIYITNDDQPVADTTEKYKAHNEVKTFSGNQIDLQVVPITAKFDYSQFYNELLSLKDTPAVEEKCEDKEGLIEKLTKTIIVRRKERRIRLYPFKNSASHFVDCLKLDTVNVTSLNAIKLTKDGKSVKRTIETDSFCSYYCKAPGVENIKFDSFEKNSTIDSILPLGLTILYISKRLVDVGYVLGKLFLLRQEHDSQYFKEMWQYCLENDRVLICARKFKQIDKVRYIELIPVYVNQSAIFLGKDIPYATEIVNAKKIDYPEEKASNKQKAAIEKLVEDLTFDFNINMIPDPSYRKKKAYLKAKLLDEAVEEVNDITLDIKVLDDHLGETAQIINERYTLSEEKKRKSAAGISKAKKAKLEKK